MARGSSLSLVVLWNHGTDGFVSVPYLSGI